jgi:predicted Rossmann fold flavoprotein
MSRIAVIGAGPAGVMAALSAAEAGASVDALDAGEPLATLLRTGGGRCNLTNAESDHRAFAACYPRGGNFLLSPFSRFGPSATREWFTDQGLALTVEDEGRVFPKAGRAQAVRDLLARVARGHGVRLRARCRVGSVRADAGGFTLTAGSGRETYDRLIIATGGDWKDGRTSGYALARALGHAVTPLAPSLAALETAEKWPARLAGLTLPTVRLAAFDGKRRIAEERGSVLFTHTGITGPLAFRISSRCAFIPFSPAAPLRMVLRLLDQGREAVEARLAAMGREKPRQQLSSALRDLVPRSLADLLPGLAGVDPATVMGQLSRTARAQVACLLDQLPLSGVGTRAGAEMVTAGGVTLDEVDPKTLASRLVPGLFFCGEVLDIDGFTGGYNLQAAWTTGRCAGLAAEG